MKKYSFLLILLFVLAIQAKAQRWDYGLWLGGANYFGDLNTHTSLRFINPAGGFFTRYNIDDRLSLRGNLNTAHIWADDRFSNVYYEYTRNLGFSSMLYEASGQIEFNFLPYSNASNISYTNKQRYTPYVFVGFGIFRFNPRAEYNGEFVNLQPLGTEGQGLDFYDLEKYKRTSTAFILGGGFKFRASKKLGMQIEGGIRKTSTDYLDDVSGVYADPIILRNESENGEMVAFLADPSVEILDEPIGQPGKMRGDNTKNDDYFFIGVGFVYTITPYKCPYPK